MIRSASEPRPIPQRGRPPRRGSLLIEPMWAAGLLGRAALIVTLVAAPWAFGGVYGWGQVWLFAGVLAAVAGWLASQWTDRRSSTTLPTAMLPLVVTLALAAMQLLPLGSTLLGRIAPGVEQVRESLASEESPAEVEFLARLGLEPASSRQPVSLYPASTRRDLALLALGVVAFFAGCELFRSSLAQLWLWSAIAVNGAAVAFFGLVQKLTWNEKLYWQVPLPEGGHPFGPFFNRNNAGGFLNLCLAGAVGLAIWALYRGGPGAVSPPQRGPQRLPANPVLGPRLRRGVVELLASWNEGAIVALSLAAFVVAGVLCSLSRGSTLALLTAAVVTMGIVLHTQRHRLELVWIAVVAAAGVALVSWVGMTGSVRGRLATLMDEEAVADGRISNWREALTVVPDFWQTGSGLGTYRYVYGLHQKALAKSWYYYAENQYIEALLEGGVVALGLMLVSLGLVAVAAWRLLRAGDSKQTFATGIVGLFALVVQAIAGGFDAGLHIPSNLLLFAVLCGAVCGRAVMLPGRRTLSWVRLGGGRPVAVACGLILLAVGAWGWMETRRSAAVEAALEKIRQNEPLAGAPEAVLRDRLAQLSAAVTDCPDDADGRYGLARLRTQLFQARAVEELRSAAGTAELSEAALRRATSPLAIHGRAHALARQSLTNPLEQLRGEPLVREHLDPALVHLVLARRACPLLLEAHLGVAELYLLAGEPAGEELHVDRARQLLPAEPNLLLRCGTLDFQAGRFDAAYRSWRQCLSLSRAHLDEVLGLAAQRPAVDWIGKLLPDQPEMLVDLAKTKYAGDADAGVRKLLLERAEELTQTIELPEETRCHVRGEIRALRGDYRAAIEQYERALELRPDDLAWRYQLAVLCQHEGLWDTAYEHAALCARTDPAREEYRALLRQVLAHRRN